MRVASAGGINRNAAGRRNLARSSAQENALQKKDDLPHSTRVGMRNRSRR